MEDCHTDSELLTQFHKNTSQLRFSGFDDEWEECKFGELYRKSSEKNDGTLGIEKNITVATMQFKDDILVSTDAYLKTYYTFNLGDIAFEGHQSKEFRFGRFVENDIGNGIVSHIFAVFRPIVNYDLMFWKYAINNEILMQRVLSRSTKASTMMHDLVTNDFLEQNFLVPTIAEQQKIGTFLSHVDSLIQAKTKKLESLKAVKKSLLQKCFPKAGEKVPEMRFAGFSGEWEYKEFKDITVSSGIKNKDNEPYVSYSITNENGFVLQDEKFENGGTMKDADKSMYWIVSPKSFAYNPARINVGSIGYQNLEEDVIVSSLYEIFKTSDDCCDEFLWHWFKSEHFNKLIQKLQEGGVRLYFYYDKLCMCGLLMPTLAEQQKIGEFFSKYNSLISAQQKEIDKLKEIKKSLLQKMFC